MAARNRRPEVTTGKHTRTKPKRESDEPVAIITRDGKTKIEHFARGRFIRLGEVRGKTLAWIELYTDRLDGHSITLTLSRSDRIAVGDCARLYHPGGILQRQDWRVSVVKKVAGD